MLKIRRPMRSLRIGGACPPILSSPHEGGRDPLRRLEIARNRFPIEADEERKLDRRRFLYAAGAAALLTVAGEWIARAVAVARPRPLEARIDAAPPIAIGEAQATAASDGADALIVRLDASTVVAFARRCPHLGCPVVWAAERGRFECPCHHAAFDARTGRVLFGPPRRGLEPVTIRTA